MQDHAGPTAQHAVLEDPFGHEDPAVAGGEGIGARGFLGLDEHEAADQSLEGDRDDSAAERDEKEYEQ